MMRRDATADFEDLLCLIGEYGAYRPPAEMDYGLAIIINRLGGWIKVCEWTYKSIPERKNAFIAVHRQVHRVLRSPEVKSLHGIPMAGIHQTTMIYPFEESRTFQAPVDERTATQMEERTEVFWGKPTKGPDVPF